MLALGDHDGNVYVRGLAMGSGQEETTFQSIKMAKMSKAVSGLWLMGHIFGFSDESNRICLYEVSVPKGHDCSPKNLPRFLPMALIPPMTMEFHGNLAAQLWPNKLANWVYKVIQY